MQCSYVLSLFLPHQTLLLVERTRLEVLVRESIDVRCGPRAHTSFIKVTEGQCVVCDSLPVSVMNTHGLAMFFVPRSCGTRMGFINGWLNKSLTVKYSCTFSISSVFNISMLFLLSTYLTRYLLYA